MIVLGFIECCHSRAFRLPLSKEISNLSTCIQRDADPDRFWDSSRCSLFRYFERGYSERFSGDGWGSWSGLSNGSDGPSAYSNGNGNGSGQKALDKIPGQRETFSMNVRTPGLIDGTPEWIRIIINLTD